MTVYTSTASDSPGPKRNYLGLKERLKATEWLVTHKKEIAVCTTAEIAKNLHADTGITMSTDTLRTYLSELLIPYAAIRQHKVKGASPNPRNARLYARILTSLIDSLGAHHIVSVQDYRTLQSIRTSQAPGHPHVEDRVDLHYPNSPEE